MRVFIRIEIKIINNYVCEKVISTKLHIKGTLF
jgi:hypothetical protein